MCFLHNYSIILSIQIRRFSQYLRQVLHKSTFHPQSALLLLLLKNILFQFTALSVLFVVFVIDFIEILLFYTLGYILKREI